MRSAVGVNVNSGHSTNSGSSFAIPDDDQHPYRITPYRITGERSEPPQTFLLPIRYYRQRL